MNINDYVFNIGDEVITVEGVRGKIVDICRCERCLDRGFCEPRWADETGEEWYITISDANQAFSSFYKIGRYHFSPFDKDKVEKDIAHFESIVNDLEKRLEFMDEIERQDPYAKIFDETCAGWTKHPELNKIFLLQQEDYANVKLKSRG